MSWLRRVGGMFRRERIEAELDEEMRSHLEMRAGDAAREGMDMREAGYEARRRFGNVTLQKERAREMDLLRWLETLAQDVRFGLRMLRKAPGFTAVAVLSLALGIGATTAIFSVTNAVLLHPLPFREADRLVLVWQVNAHDPTDISILSAPNYWDWRQQNTVFESMAIFDSGGRGYNLSQGSEPEQVSGLRVSADFFRVLGVEPMLGRTFLPEEETAGRDREVVLSYGLWQRRYAGDPAIAGKLIRVDGEAFTVTGVMPREFHFAFESTDRELWVPVGYTPGDRDRSSQSFDCIARMKAGVTVALARAEMDTIGRRLMAQYPKEDNDTSATVSRLSDYGLQQQKRVLGSLFGAVGLVLLIVCVNVANLMLARSAARQREIAVRRAIGAGRMRIVRQLVTESVLLSLAGAAAGVLLAMVGVSFLADVLPFYLKFAPFRPVAEIPIDWKVLAFALAIACAAGVLSGLAPALSAFGSDVTERLKESSGRGATDSGGQRLRNTLAMAEVALALVVVASAALLMTSVSRLLDVQPGFDSKNVLTADLTTPQANLYYGPPDNPRLCDELQEHVGAMPGVISVSATSRLPLLGIAGRQFLIAGRPDPGPDNEPYSRYGVTCPKYFRTMGMRLVGGREFGPQDTRTSAPVALISEATARAYWKGADSVGQQIRITGAEFNAPWMTIVGVVGDARTDALDDKPPKYLYRPFTQAGWPLMTIVARTAAAPELFVNPVRRAITDINPDMPASNLKSMESVMKDSVADRRFPMLLVVSFGVLALALAAVGIYGVVGYGVTQRTREIGIRMAFGAEPGQVLGLMVGGSMAWTLAGVAIGICGSVAAGQLFASLLYGVKATDPLVLGCAGAILVVVALMSSLVPARRAMRVDPMVALRNE